MADWITIVDTQVDPDAPVTSELGYAFRDNPIAIAEGATGAPRVVDGALSTTVTSAGTTWVYNRILNRTVGGVGTIVMGIVTGLPAGGPWFANDTIAGSNLATSSAGGTFGTVGSLSGTWRCCGRAQDVNSTNVTIWQRTV